MWKSLKQLFEGEGGSGARAELDPQVAASALLVEAALADGIYAEIESDLITRIICDSFELSEDACAALLQQAEELAEEAVDHHRFTKVAKTLPLATREKLVEGLWRVVFADGEESPFEEAFVRRVGPLLAVDDRTSRIARQRVVAETSPR